MLQYIHSHPKKFRFGFWVWVSYPKPKIFGYETQTLLFYQELIHFYREIKK